MQNHCHFSGIRDICHCLMHLDENAKGAVKVDVKCGAPFEPANVYKMLQAIDFEAFKVGCLVLRYGCLF